MGPLEPELLLCIPGPWNDRSEFVRTIVSETDGEFLFAGMIMAQPGRNEHVPLDFAPHDPQMRKAFEIAGQGQLPEPLLQQLGEHRGVAYLHFPVRIINEKERVIRFTAALRRCRGLAVKIESAGIAHEWDQWFSALNSERPVDLYRSFVVLVGDSRQYYSCGMHHFGLPDVEVDRKLEIREAADLMNRFNTWQIVEEPNIASGHTFSVTADAPRYRITSTEDSRHDPSNPFHNAHGVWNLIRAR